jgi:AcrR family transcriptional regulator
MPRSSKEKSEETRQKIMRAAYQSFMANGFSASSIREISQRAGVTVGAIYNHFTNKEEIWIEVLTNHHPYHEILPILQSTEGATIPDIVRDAASKLVAALDRHPDLLNLMFIEIVEFNTRHVPLLFEMIFPEIFKLQNTFAGKEGKLREVPTPVLLRAFVGLFFSYYITGVLLTERIGLPTDEKALNAFVDLFLYGMMADDDPSRQLLHPRP